MDVCTIVDVYAYECGRVWTCVDVCTIVDVDVYVYEYGRVWSCVYA